MDRGEALALLMEYTENPNLVKHGLAVEAAMRHYARKFGEDEERWAIAGLLHDFDYEKYPNLEDHPFRGVEILRAKGVDEEILQAILGHSDHTGISRTSLMARSLYAVDELSGFIIAVALVRPDRQLATVEVKSVRKKFKDKAFARAVDRAMIDRGIEELGVTMDNHIATVINALSSISSELDL